MSRFTGRDRRRLAAVVGVALLASSLTACSDTGGPDDAVAAFLGGWRAGKLDKVALVRPDGTKVGAADVLTELKGLAGELADTPPELKITGKGTAAAKITSLPVAA